MKLVWTCSYDGKICEYEKVDVKDGEICNVPKGVEEHWGINAPGSWDRCVNCPHSCSIGVSNPRLAIIYDNGAITRL